MNCKNCGARLKENTKVCPNCGAFIDDNEGYVLLTSDDTMFDIYADNEPPKKKKKGSGVIRFLSALLTLLIIGGGAYYYFINFYDPTPDKPALSFESGNGIINDDEEIIYVLLSENSKIEYIHGVSLYDYDKTDKNAQKKDAVSTDYEYTKNIDSTFRAIFFDADKLNIKDGNNTYTFEMNFSFYDSDEVYTYNQVINFSSEFTLDASDLIFDHSQSEKTTSQSEATAKQEESTTKAQSTTEASSDGYDFIYNSYWYTEPFQNGEEYIINAIKFSSDKTYTSTNYYKNGNESWKVSNYNGTYEIKDGYLVVNNGEATESTYYKIDTKNNTLFEEENNQPISTLTSRKYNSIKNAEDFFGI